MGPLAQHDDINLEVRSARDATNSVQAPKLCASQAPAEVQKVGWDTVRWGCNAFIIEPETWSAEKAKLIDPETGEICTERWLMDFGSGARLTFYRRSERPPLAVIECSLPRYVQGSNLLTLSASEAVQVMSSVTKAASAFVTFTDDFPAHRVYRVDQVTDFRDADCPERLLDALSKMPAYRAGTSLNHDRDRAGAMTLRRGPKDAEASLYDKGGEVRHRATRARNPERRSSAQRDLPHAAGVLRFESRVRGRHLGRLGMSSVSDLDQEKLARVHEDLFHQLGFGMEVVPMSALVEKVTNSGKTAAVQANLLGWCIAELSGVDLGLSRGTTDRNKALLHDLGVTAADLLADGDRVQLDYETARMVTKASNS